MLKIGITGGIGTGKTTVSHVFEILGVPVFYADRVAKLLMQTDTLLKEKLRKAFGQDTYQLNGELNSRYLATLVFNDEQKLQALNELVHPVVFRTFEEWVSTQKTPYVIKEAALLFETGSYQLCDQNILLTSPIELRIHRVMQRDQTTKEEIVKRISKQWDDVKKARLADFIVSNDEHHLLIPQILHLHQIFLILAENIQ